MTLAEVHMNFVIKPTIPLLDQCKMQTRILVPVLKTLRAKIGEERTNRLVMTALHESARNMVL